MIEVVDSDVKDFIETCNKGVVDVELMPNVENFSSMKDAVSSLRKIIITRKKIEQKKKELTSPVDSANKKIKSFFDQPIKTFKDRENLIRKSITRYFNYQEELLDGVRDEQLKRMKEAIKSPVEDFLPASPIDMEPMGIKGVSFVKKFAVEIEDPKIVPKDYLTPNLKKIEEVVNSTSGVVNIPGVRVIKKHSVVVRAVGD